MVNGNVLVTLQRTSVTLAGSVMLTEPSMTLTPNLNWTENVGIINVSVFVMAQWFVPAKQWLTPVTSRIPV
jgi:hypothetical protein